MSFCCYLSFFVTLYSFGFAVDMFAQFLMFHVMYSYYLSPTRTVSFKEIMRKICVFALFCFCS